MVKTSSSSAGDVGSIPGQGAKILYASGLKNQSMKGKQCGNKLNKDFKSGPHQKKENTSCNGITHDILGLAFALSITS